MSQPASLRVPEDMKPSGGGGREGGQAYLGLTQELLSLPLKVVTKGQENKRSLFTGENLEKS